MTSVIYDEIEGKSQGLNGASVSLLFLLYHRLLEIQSHRRKLLLLVMSVEDARMEVLVQ